MNKIWLIASREYWIKVRKRSFILMTFLTPLLFAAIFVLPVILAVGLESEKIVEVIDESGKFKDKLKEGKKLRFVTSSHRKVEDAVKGLAKSKNYAVLYIPTLDMEKPQGVQIFAEKSVSAEIKSNIEEKIEAAIEDMKMIASGIDKKALEKIRTRINIDTRKASGEESSSEAATIVGYIAAFMMYMAVLIYGSQVMLSVLEEKTSRVVEVIISSIKPFQLMMGKVIGTAMIGITQFILWIVLTFGMVTVASQFLNLEDRVAKQQMEQSVGDNPEAQKMIQKRTESAGNVFSALATLNMPKMIFMFLFYFIFGYLMYSAMFAAAAAAVDNQQDVQQFTMPISMPMILAIVMSTAILRDPDSTLSFWLSIIPFTSPIIMMIRMPYDVPLWQLILSMLMLVGGFVVMTWLAARIYRVGILMYGKKPTYKELGKWIFYKV
jgi:ABC-2 type transport system permease protein